MKAYILYLATLLAALVLPATAQTGSTNTKAAPDFPSMPYRLTVNTIGDNQGEVTFEDKSYKGGVVTIDNANHAYANQDPAKTTTVTPTITSNPGYALDNGYPKAYKTGDPTTTVTIAADGTFAMPTHPVTFDVKYIKVDDLDLGLATLTGKEVTLIYDGGKNTWKYKVGADTTLFTGTLKGKGTCNLKITSSNSKRPALYLANGTELTGNIEIAVGEEIELGLGATEAGTVATVKGNITVTKNSSLKCYVSLRLNIYGEVTGSTDTANFMQWTWTKAPESGKTITIYTPLEETLTTFTADNAHTTFATNYSYGTTAKVEVKVKVGDAIQKDKDNKIIFPTDNVYGYLCSFTGMEDSKLEPVEEVSDGITITGGTTYKPGTDGGGTPANFSGTITGDVSTIKVDAAVKDNPIIILSDVKKKGDTPNTVEVADKAEVTLALKGTANEVSTMTVLAGGTLTLTTVAGGASFAKNMPPTIANNGTFISETRLIKKVGGTAPLEVTGEPVGKQIAKDEEYTLKVEANIPVPAAPKAMTRAADPVPSYQWQKYTSEYGWRPTGDNIPTYATTEAGTYRCEVTYTNGTATTTLTTQVAEVTLKSDPGPGPGPDPVPDPDPTPTPTFYTVTLPTVEGFTSNPVAGVHSVEEGHDFSFTLTKKEGYKGNDPIVTTSRGETVKPRPADGKYVISGIYEDITISFASTPTANEAFGPESIRISSSIGQLLIQTPQPAIVTVYTLSGQNICKLDIPAGDSTIKLPVGFYIVTVGSQKQKVIIR